MEYAIEIKSNISFLPLQCARIIALPNKFQSFFVKRHAQTQSIEKKLFIPNVTLKNIFLSVHSHSKCRKFPSPKPAEKSEEILRYLGSIPDPVNLPL